MNFACVFATWFGAETVLSVSATFAHKGFGGIWGDPFGASTCLVLVAFFFARTFYRMELLTIGDYYHQRYGKIVEVIASLGIASSYLGWTSAQLSALGLVINVLFPQITLTQSILIGAAIVTVYTLFGGMWSVALTDVIQTAAIVLGLIVVALLLGHKAGGIDVVIAEAHKQGKLNLFPHVTAAAWMTFIGEFITMSLGSIPQQDVFQRVTSAKNEQSYEPRSLEHWVAVCLYFPSLRLRADVHRLFGNRDRSRLHRSFSSRRRSRNPENSAVAHFERDTHLVPGAVLRRGAVSHSFHRQRHIAGPGQSADRERAATAHQTFQ